MKTKMFALLFVVGLPFFGSGCVDGQQTIKTDPVTAAPSQQATPAEVSKDCLIKGNISASGEKIYHEPRDRFYDVTQIDPANGEKWFCTPDEAKASGWRHSKV